MRRVEELRKMDQALARVNRISTGRVAARARSERSGVMLSGPAISILGALCSSGPVRLSSLSRATGLEASLISREIRELGDAGYIFRTPDPTDGRAGIVEATAKGTDAWKRYCVAADSINAETFTEWSTEDLHTLRTLLERVAHDRAKSPSRTDRATRVG